MKVLLIHIYFSKFGGGEVIAYDTYNLLKDNGIDAYFMATNKKPFWEKDYKYANFFTNNTTSLKEYIKNPINYYYNIQAKKDVHKIINYVKPDIIHLHNVISGFSVSILECCKNIPTVMTIHDVGLICPATTLLLNNKTICKEFKCKDKNFINCLLNKCAEGKLEASIRKTIRSYMIPPNLKYINKFITPSNALRDLVIASHIGIDESKIYTINNFLPEESLNIKPNPYTNNGYFLYTSQLTEIKGFKHLLQVFKEISPAIKLHVAGEGHLKSWAQNFIKENNLNNITLLGHLTREELKEEYQNCISTILPSNCFDNFPTTNMESFINGKPVIASNIGGIPEQVEHNKTGLLFEPGNVEQLKECILKYWNNPQLVIEHGKNGYQKAVTQYTSDRYYKELQAIYQIVCKSEIS